MLSMLSMLLIIPMAGALTGVTRPRSTLGWDTHGSHTLHLTQRRRQSHCRLTAASDEAGTKPPTAQSANEPPSAPTSPVQAAPASGVLAAAGAFTLAALAGSAYCVVSFLGFDAGAGGDNGGYGAPLSTQELRQLQTDEKLQRKTLLSIEGPLNGVGRADVEDQEDEALLRIIAEQGPRSR